MNKTLWKIAVFIFVMGPGFFMTLGNYAQDLPMSTETEWKLPAPKKKGRVSLEQALSLRRSSKEGFTSQELTEKEIGQILWAARGVNRPDGKLTSPSAMARYSVSVYVATNKGTFLYIPENHSLSSIDDKDIRKGVGTQDYVKTAPAIIILVADYSKLPDTLSMERKISFVCAEAGTIGENVYLQCAALKLGTVFIGSVDRDFVKSALNFTKDIEPLFIMPIGHPK